MKSSSSGVAPHRRFFIARLAVQPAGRFASVLDVGQQREQHVEWMSTDDKRAEAVFGQQSRETGFARPVSRGADDDPRRKFAPLNDSRLAWRKASSGRSRVAASIDRSHVLPALAGALTNASRKRSAAGRRWVCAFAS